MPRLYRFYRCNIQQKSILIVETNEAHGETIPSFVRYFKQLGYTANILIHKKHIEDKTLQCVNDDIKVFAMSFHSIIVALGMRDIAKYEWVFFNSLITYGYVSVFWHNTAITSPKYGFIVLQHNAMIECLYPNNLVMISLLLNILKTWANPHYFGDIKHRDKNRETIFIIAGKDISDARKNIDSLQTVITTLKHINTFKIKIMGNTSKETRESLQSPRIKFMGYVDYPTLYQEISNADFLLTMLDSHNPKHDRYLVDVSGSFQLVYGFNIIPIVDKKFANRYFIDDNNGLIYDDNTTLDKLVESAINMDNATYQGLKKALKQTSDTIYSKSLRNLYDITQWII